MIRCNDCGELKPASMGILKSQGNKCAGCGSAEHRHPRFTITKDSGWIVDHNHESGAIRGVLCWYCNVALGYVRDSPATLEALASYVRKNAAVNTLLSGLELAHERKVA